MEGMMRPGELRRAIEGWVVANSGHEADRDYLGMSQISRCPAELYGGLVTGREAPGAGLSALFREGYLHQADLERCLKSLGILAPGRELVADWDPRFRGHTDGELVDADGAVELLELKSLTGDRFAWVRDENRCFEEHFDQVQMYLLYGGYARGMVLYKCRESGRVWPVPVRGDVERQALLVNKARAVLAAVDAGRRPACTCGRHNSGLGK